MRSRTVTMIFGAVIGLLVLIQLIPYGRNHSNPSITGTPAWDSPDTERLARRACFNCHSNETSWPWYASIAPASWRVQHDVDEGRSKLNFSAANPGDEAGDAAETVRKGKMPPGDYMLMHPEARLSAAERKLLAEGLAATFGERKEKAEPGEREEKGEQDHRD
jgi:hypothetical protein